MKEVFKILQYSEMECNFVRKITEGLFRKYSTFSISIRVQVRIFKMNPNNYDDNDDDNRSIYIH
jgi:hypothetical protein